MSSEPRWLPDPEAPGHLRYWEGHAWTPFTVRAPVLPPVDQQPRRRRLLPIGIGMAIVLACLVILGSAVGGSPDDDSIAAPGDGDAAVEDHDDAATPSPDPTPETVSVPDVVGLALAQARTEIGESGLDVASIKRRTSVKRPGTVLRQSRTPGRELAAGTRIHLVVAGPWPRTPSVTGMSSGVALTKLKKAGFRVHTSQRRTTTGRDGVVLNQVPKVGRTVKPGSTIRVVIADLHKPPPPKQESCTTGYSHCLPPASDYDCAGGSGDGPAYARGPIRVTGSDPYDLDDDGDGIACEA